MRKYAFHQDAGHGWLAVPVSDLTDEAREWISDCSYHDARAGIVYLEEDCDARLAPVPHEVVYVDHRGDAPCRRLPRWQAKRSFDERVGRLIGGRP